MPAPRKSLEVIRAVGQALARRPRGTVAPPPVAAASLPRPRPRSTAPAPPGPAPAVLGAEADDEPTGVFTPHGPAWVTAAVG